jgi:hypothetical protein
MSSDGKSVLQKFAQQFQPHESGQLVLITDNRTGAQFCECYIPANKLVAMGTIDAPLDPSQPG